MNDTENVTTESGVIVAVVPDVFFSVTVRNAIRAAGYEARIVKSVSDLSAPSDGDPPRLVIVDLGAVRVPDNWAALSEVERSGTPVLVFGPHKDVEGFRAAKAAGVRRVVSNGQFHGDMVGFITRYVASGESMADVGEQGDSE